MRPPIPNWTRCAILLIGVTTVGCGDKPATTPAPAPVVTKGTPAAGKGGPPAARGPVAFKTTADALTKEMIADEKKAEAKYQGKVIEVEGRVETANKFLYPNGFFLQGTKRKPTDTTGVMIICNVPKGAEGMVWRLSLGQKVKVVGTAGIGYSVGLANCTVEPLEPPTTPRVTAKGLAEEVLKDADAARKKYEGPMGGPKGIIVEGVVAALETEKRFHIVKLAGAGGVTVNCTVAKKDLEALKAGDAVTIKGDFSGYYPDQKEVTVNTAFVLPKE